MRRKEFTPHPEARTLNARLTRTKPDRGGYPFLTPARPPRGPRSARATSISSGRRTRSAPHGEPRGVGGAGRISPTHPLLRILATRTHRRREGTRAPADAKDLQAALAKRTARALSRIRARQTPRRRAPCGIKVQLPHLARGRRPLPRETRPSGRRERPVAQKEQREKTSSLPATKRPPHQGTSPWRVNPAPKRPPHQGTCPWRVSTGPTHSDPPPHHQEEDHPRGGGAGGRPRPTKHSIRPQEMRSAC